jgi:hypothetical protein
MRALTLWRPWCWAIVLGAKPVENRGWPPFESVIGQRIAIHSGQQYDKQGAEFIARAAGALPLLVPDSLKWPGGLIVGTVRVQGWISPTDRNGITADDAAALRESRWYMGSFGWVLRDPQKLREPVPCRGAQGLWTVPTDVEARVRRQLGEAA